MSIEAQGTITFQSFGLGVWALAASETTYELFEPPTELQQEGLAVKVTGNIRDDIMTVAMIGPVLDVKNFEILSS